MNCARTDVVKVYRAWQNSFIENKQIENCGDPRTIDESWEQHLRRCVRAEPHTTMEQLTTQMDQGATARK